MRRHGKVARRARLLHIAGVAGDPRGDEARAHFEVVDGAECGRHAQARKQPDVLQRGGVGIEDVVAVLGAQAGAGGNAKVVLRRVARGRGSRCRCVRRAGSAWPRPPTVTLWPPSIRSKPGERFGSNRFVSSNWKSMLSSLGMLRSRLRFGDTATWAIGSRIQVAPGVTFTKRIADRGAGDAERRG